MKGTSFFSQKYRIGDVTVLLLCLSFLSAVQTTYP